MSELSPNDLLLDHRYHDEEEVQGASFVAKFSDGSTREGSTDVQGLAVLKDVPHGPVEVKFKPDARVYDQIDKTKNARSGQSLDDIVKRHAPK